MDISKEKINEETERWLLINFIYEKEKSLDEHVANNVKDILSGKYEEVLTNGLDSDIITLLQTSDNFQQTISDIIQENANSHHLWLCVGIASLLKFVQYNWTGPGTDDNDDDWLTIKNKEAIEYLSFNEECNENVKRPELLYFAKLIFSNDFLQTTYKSSIWWLFRSHLLHHYVLEENCAVLFKQTECAIAKVNDLDMLEDSYCKTLFNIEVAQFYFCNRRIQSSEKHVYCAESIAKLNCEMRGRLGRRTKYQQDEKPQLYLHACAEKECFYSRDCQHVPKSIDLNDDVRLEKIEFSDAPDKIELNALEEAIVLAKYAQMHFSEPSNKLIHEELISYLCAIIESTKNWSLKVTALVWRSILETKDKRSIERSMMQMEYLMDEINSTAVPVQERLDLFFTSGMKPIWRSKVILANIMLRLGLVKNALDIFIKMNRWDKVIVCYNALNLKHKAASVIQEQIAKKPTVKLWCLLGDATQDPKHYETAWELSGKRSSRAQKHWGLYHFAKHEYAEAIPHLKLSVELNNIQEEVWFKLGFAAMKEQQWQLAAKAYKSYCALEQSSFEAWNNLANVYVKLGDKQKAWAYLQDAIKCDYNHWQVWDNNMTVSIDLGQFLHGIKCYHRILDLKDSHVDIQILDILTKAILNNEEGSDETPSKDLLPKALELFGRITSNVTYSPDIWRMYAELTLLKNTKFDDQKAARYLQQAYRNVTSNPKLFQEIETTQYVVDLCCDLTKVYMKCAENATEISQKQSLLASAKLSLQGVIKRINDKQWNDVDVDGDIAKAEECLKTVIDELEKLKAQTD